MAQLYGGLCRYRHMHGVGVVGGGGKLPRWRVKALLGSDPLLEAQGASLDFRSSLRYWSFLSKFAGRRPLSLCVSRRAPWSCRPCGSVGPSRARAGLVSSCRSLVRPQCPGCCAPAGWAYKGWEPSDPLMGRPSRADGNGSWKTNSAGRRYRHESSGGCEWGREDSESSRPRPNPPCPLLLKSLEL